MTPIHRIYDISNISFCRIVADQIELPYLITSVAVKLSENSNVEK